MKEHAGRDEPRYLIPLGDLSHLIIYVSSVAAIVTEIERKMQIYVNMD